MSAPHQSDVDAVLDDVTARQLAWKPGVAQRVAVLILSRMIGQDDRIVWPDQIDTTTIAGRDRNVIGMTWRKLVALGVIRRTSGFRRSRGPVSNGRTIFSYRIADERLARAFLKRNACATPDGRGTPELPL